MLYADREDADGGYDTLLDLHSADLVGSYDVALVYKDDEGKVRVPNAGGDRVPSTPSGSSRQGLVARVPIRRWVLPSGPHAAGTTHLMRASRGQPASDSGSPAGKDSG